MVGTGVELLNDLGTHVMLKHFCRVAIALVLVEFSMASFAQNEVPEHTPFDSYVRVADKIFVYDQSQFSPYTGPDVSHWELLYTDDDPFFERKRLGVISLTPTQYVYLDSIWDPMSQYYELRDTKSGRLIHKFEYYGAAFGLLLFSGRGVVYEFRQMDMLCHGNTTNKYVYENGALSEVAQPLHLLSDAESISFIDIKLLNEPKINSTQVASLLKGTKVTVLALKQSPKKDPADFWLLIKTPLGLTGWVSGGLDIGTCN